MCLLLLLLGVLRVRCRLALWVLAVSRWMLWRLRLRLLLLRGGLLGPLCGSWVVGLALWSRGFLGTWLLRGLTGRTLLLSVERLARLWGWGLGIRGLRLWRPLG